MRSLRGSAKSEGRRGKAGSIRFPLRSSPFALLCLLLSLAACRGTLSPVSNRLKIGEEAFTVFVADGEGGVGDLYAVPVSGGVPFQVTFTRVDESGPALTNDGSVVAFIRGAQRSGVQPVVVVLNLLNGAERRIELPAGSLPARVAWSPDQTRLYIRTATGDFGAAAPPSPAVAAPVVASESAAADSALSVLLGSPAFAAAGACQTGGGVCARSDSGETLLDAEGRDPTRWGPDSVAYVSGGEVHVLPLGGGHLRAVLLSRQLPGIRQPTYAAGPGAR